MGGYLSISRISIKYIGKEFTGTSHARDDQPVDVKTIDNEEMGQRVLSILRMQGRGYTRGGRGVLRSHGCRRRRGHNRRRLRRGRPRWGGRIGLDGGGTALEAAHLALDQFGHAIEVDQHTEEDLVRGGAVFVDARQVAQDADAGDVLAVEGQDAGGLGTEIRRAIGGGDVPMDLFVMRVVGGGDLGQQARHHLDDIRDRHGADLILPVRHPGPRPWVSLAGGEELLAGQTLDVREVADLDAAGRARLRTAQRAQGPEGRPEPGRRGGGVTGRSRRVGGCWGEVVHRRTRGVVDRRSMGRGV